MLVSEYVIKSVELWLRLETACNIIFIRKTVGIVEGTDFDYKMSMLQHLMAFLYMMVATTRFTKLWKPSETDVFTTFDSKYSSNSAFLLISNSVESLQSNFVNQNIQTSIKLLCSQKSFFLLKSNFSIRR